MIKESNVMDVIFKGQVTQFDFVREFMRLAPCLRRLVTLRSCADAALRAQSPGPELAAFRATAPKSWQITIKKSDTPGGLLGGLLGGLPGGQPVGQPAGLTARSRSVG